MPNEFQSENKRVEKGDLNEFTHIETEQGEYELWNAINKYQQNEVLEQLSLEEGSLPLSTKDRETQNLLFGKGAFGKVRLAKKAEKFYAVKKIVLASADNNSINAVMKEYKFGKLLEKLNIPHVAYSTDSAVAQNQRGEKKLYLFMDKIASLDNGENLKNLLSYLDSSEERDAILKHTALSLFESVAAMHENKICHRDLKASNILFNSAGQVYISDFGSASINNKELISEILGEKTSAFEVSSKSDQRYYPPEIHLAIKQRKALASSQPLDNWRLGLTLLQLCGCIKEKEGILSNIGSWVKSLNTTPENLEKIKNHFIDLITEIKLNSIDKIPQELRDVIFGLLEVDVRKRLTAKQALEKLQAKGCHNAVLVSQGFKNLTHIQVAQTTKKYIKRALTTEAATRGNEWLANAIDNFKKLVHDPYTTVGTLETFINTHLSELNRPTITQNQLQITLDLSRKKQQRKAEGLNRLSINENVTSATQTTILPEIIESSPENLNWSYTQIPTQVSSATDNTENEIQYTEVTGTASLDKHYADVTDKLTSENYYTDVIGKLSSKETVSSSDTADKKNTQHDAELEQLEKRVKESLDRLLEHVKKKGGHSSFEVLKEQSINGLNTLLQRIKKHLYPSRFLGFFNRKKDEIQIKQHAAPHDSPIDEKAIKAVIYRQQQIVSQLTLSKLFSLNENELMAVKRMFEKDRDFLIDIMKKLDSISEQYQNPIVQISNKLKLIENILSNNVDEEVAKKYGHLGQKNLGFFEIHSEKQAVSTQQTKLTIKRLDENSFNEMDINKPK